MSFEGAEARDPSSAGSDTDRETPEMRGTPEQTGPIRKKHTVEGRAAVTEDWDEDEEWKGRIRLGEHVP